MSRPFHLVVYTEALERGGAEVVLGTVLAALPEHIRISVVTTHPVVADYLGAKVPRADVRFTPQITGRTDLAGWWRHRRLFRELDPDILHFNLGIMSACQWAMLVASTIPGIRMVAVENSPMGAWSPLSRRLVRLNSRRLAAHAAVGQATARFVEESGQLPAGSVETIYHGVLDVRRDVPPEPHDGPVVVNIARHDPVKGVDVLIAAMAQVDPGVKLVQIGDGPETAALQALADELGLGDRVEFRQLAVGDPAADHLAAFDLFVLPSRLEGYPVTVMEAMLAGLAVVVTDVGSVREQVVEGETGLVVPIEDPAAMARAITALLDDPDRRAAMGKRGREIAEERFTVQATVDAYVSLFDRVLSGS